MNKLASLCIAALLLTNIKLSAQTGFWESRDAYLGQNPPGDKPKIFAQKLLARKDTFALDRVAFSKDGREFYYPTNNDWFSNKNVKVCCFKYKGAKWTGPFVLNKHYYAPTFSIDNKTLYFLGGEKDSLHALVWKSERTGDGWTKPSVYLKKDYGTLLVYTG